VTQRAEVAVDLSNCDREPIHVPGAIQPHGVLLALVGPELNILQVSENVAQHLGLPAAEVLGRPLASVLPDAPLAELRQALAGGEFLPFTVVRGAARFDALAHATEGAAILELEPAAPDTEALHNPLRSALGAVQGARTAEELCAIAVREVRRITGYERVMVYRFDEQGHGAVIAEDRDASLEPYLGLHYPASDIPQQARALYLKNWLRIIPDARYSPSRLVPERRPDTGTPLDLSFCVLRSISPIHREYLANMGVRASLSVSLIVRDRLWGLLSCGNHSAPRHVPAALRSATEVLGRLVSLQLAAFADREAAVRRAARRETQEALVAAMRESHGSDDVLGGLLTAKSELLSLVGADGAAVVRSGELYTAGRAPSASLIRAVANWLEERGEVAPFCTDSLARLIPAAESEKDVAAGLLTFALPGIPRRRLLWFRPELVHTVAWGGDPHKPAEVDPNARLHPRRSFELWKEEVHLRALPWKASDIEAAEELRRNVVESDLERQLLREQRAVQMRDDLVAVVSHDLRSPLGVIQMQAALLSAPDEGDPSSPRVRNGLQRIQRAVDRMTALIRDLLDLARIEAGHFELDLQPLTIRDVIDDTLTIVRAQADAKQIVIREEVVDGRALGDRERIFQVLSNLLTNAIRFTPEGGQIDLHATLTGAQVLFTVADTGPGVPAEQLPHLFDRYWQARRAGHSGTGLGLYIAKGIVEAHGGRIWVESPPGSGARFQFTLPAV
jgi:light-regulated signal transduction histidine kinase (bacteriophytochrome)